MSDNHRGQMDAAYYLGGGDPAVPSFPVGAFDVNPLLLVDQSAPVGYGLQHTPHPWFGFPQNQAAPPPPHYPSPLTTPLAMPTVDPSVESVGWGGQIIADNGGYHAPWFGPNKAKNGNQRGNRGRGRNAGGDNRGQQRNKGHWNRSRSSNDSSGSDGIMTVEEMTRLVRACPDGSPLSAEIYHGIRHFDSRTCSVLLKDLCKLGICTRATEIFDTLRNSGAMELKALCDVYTYTAMISMCIYQQDVDRAMGLIEEMRQRGIERNVHTYTALMNVCIKCGKCQLALESYKNMRDDGIDPNVVTYNTLIDIYGKMGQWEQAVKVVASMKGEVHCVTQVPLTSIVMQGVDAVLRTYNTLIISCNMCNQPREALAAYARLLAEGFCPNATTYNALISAYGKAGQFDKVMEVFQEMVYKGCERSVITYSSLISACEKAGHWKVALELFTEMQREGCVPNTVTYNSLITACAQGTHPVGSNALTRMTLQVLSGKRRVTFLSRCVCKDAHRTLLHTLR